MSDHDMMMAERHFEIIEVLVENNIHFMQLQTIGSRFMFYTRQDGDYVVGILDGAGVDAGWNDSYETPYTLITCSLRSWEHSP